MIESFRDNTHALVVIVVLIGAGIAGTLASFLYGDWE
jgi:hypothetical protein